MDWQPDAMQPESANRPAVRRVSSARTKLLVSLGTGIAGGTATAPAGAGRAAPLVGWDILALVFGVWVWSTIWRLDAESTASHARRKDPSSGLIDVMRLGAAAASLTAMGIVLADDGSGIAFNETAAPDYGDFAWLSFTIGMTFQLSDTDIGSKQIRRTALRHAWLSFPVGAVIMATTINAVALAMTLMRFQAGGQGPLCWMSPRVVRWVQTGDRLPYLVRDPRGRLTERRAPDRAPIARRLPPRHPRWRVRGTAGRGLRVWRLSRSLNPTWRYLRDGSPDRHLQSGLLGFLLSDTRKALFHGRLDLLLLGCGAVLSNPSERVAGMCLVGDRVLSLAGQRE